MKIATKYHGEIDIQAADIIRFEQGVPGFFDEKQFVLLPLMIRRLSFCSPFRRRRSALS